MKIKILNTTLPLASSASSSFGADLFIPENGRYELSFEEVARAIDDSQTGYLILRPELVILNAKYKLMKGRNEFKIKDWYKNEWYKLQDTQYP